MGAQQRLTKFWWWNILQKSENLELGLGTAYKGGFCPKFEKKNLHSPGNGPFQYFKDTACLFSRGDISENAIFGYN